MKQPASATRFPGLTRRAFVATATAASLPALPALAADRAVAIVVAAADTVANSPPAQWATGLLKDALAARGMSPRIVRGIGEAAPGETRIAIAGGTSPLARDLLGRFDAAMPPGAEALALIGATLDNADTILAAGSDARGLVYAVTELLDRIVTAPDTAAGLSIGAPLLQHPANKVRGISRMFSSAVEDRGWLHDRAFWTDYLTMLATHRVNRFSLTFGLQYNFPMEVSDVYLYFAYPFLMAVPGYDVRAKGLPDDERDRNFESLKFIAAETAKRGIGFQLGLWTHGYKFDSPRANYLIEGIDEQNHAAYCSDAMTRLLSEVPEIDGVSLRIHGESGIREGDYDFWQTVFRGIQRAHRPVGIDMHAKGIDKKTIDLALETGLPVTLSPKFMGEHLGLPYHESAIRGTDTKPASTDAHFTFSEGSRRFTRYSYGDFLREDRKYGIVWRVWPGTQRLLASGDPAFFAGYSRAAGFAGANGIEFCEPLSFKGRMGSGRAGSRTGYGYADRGIAPGEDWQKFSQFHRLWNRMMYDPFEPPLALRRALVQSVGPAANDLEAALASASRILPLVTQAHGPSASNNSYWPEIYTNLPIVQDSAGKPYYDTPMPARFATAESFDPEIFATVEQAAAAYASGTAEARYTPVDVAGWLDALSSTALVQLAAARRAQPAANAELRRTGIDIEIMAQLGKFFAAKFRSGVFWSLYQRSLDRAVATEAVRHYRLARDAWNEAARAGAVYAGDIAFGPEPWLRGHWRDRLPAIDADLAEMTRLAADTNGTEPPRKLVPHDRLWAAIGQILATPARPRIAARQFSPARFTPGQKFTLAIAAPEDVTSARLHYRHVNQAEPWMTADMKADGGRFKADIGKDYATADYPLQYYYELRGDDVAGLFPGLNADLTGQPYYVIRPEVV